MKMTHCTHYQDDLKAYADGELPLLRRALVRRHLTHCASCREEILEMTQLTEDLRATEPEDALSPSLREKILTAPAAEPTEAGASTPAPKRPRKRLIPTWGYAALAVVAWFVFFPLFQKAQISRQAQLFSPTAVRVRMQGERTARASQQSALAPPAPLRATAGAGNGPVFPQAPPPPEHPSPSGMTYESNGPAMPGSAPPPPPPMAVHALMAPHITTRLSNREAGTGDLVISNPLNGDPDSLRQVHKEASIGIQVPNPDATGDTLNNMVRETGGYVAANNLTTGDDGMKSGELVVKVPEAQFETFLAAVAKLGVVQSKSITGEDITEKTSDAHEAQSVEESDLAQAEARLKNLGKHASYEDREDAQDERVKLAQTRARLKLLKRMAALGTLTIDLSETPKGTIAPPVTTGFGGTLKATTHDALQSLVGSAGALLALVIWLLAYSPIWVPLLLVGRYAVKEYKKRETAV